MRFILTLRLSEQWFVKVFLSQVNQGVDEGAQDQDIVMASLKPSGM